MKKSKYKTWSDIALVKGIQAGNKCCENELCVRYLTTVRRILMSKLTEKADAEDLVQDTMIVLMKKLRGPSLKQPEKLAAFITKTTQNIMIADYRKQARRRRITEEKYIYHVENETPTEVELTEHQQFGEICDSLQTKVSQLKNVRDRLIIQQFYLMDLDKQLVCSNLSLTANGFDRVVSRARQRLGRVFDTGLAA